MPFLNWHRENIKKYFALKVILALKCLTIVENFLTEVKFYSKVPDFVTDHFTDHSTIPKHQVFPGYFHHLIEHYGERLIIEQEKNKNKYQTFPVTTFLAFFQFKWWFLALSHSNLLRYCHHLQQK